ncbi:MAG TPA: hypothetical protein VLA52_02080, partial [Thermohalobaculum sp.]|nr:hypothetical protein [Thermohalobaculum sp.]
PADEALPAESRPAYVLRTPLVGDRARLRRLARLMGARPVSEAELAAVLRQGLRAIYKAAGDPDGWREEAALLDRVEELAAELAPLAASIPPPEAEGTPQGLAARHREIAAELEELAPLAAEIERIVERDYEPYRERIAELAFWGEAVQLCALRLFLVGIDEPPGHPLPKPGPEGLSEADLAAVPEARRDWLAAEALKLLAPGEDEAKN